METGTRSFGAAAAALGAIGLTWGAFALFWQPIPPDLPGYGMLAYTAGTMLLAGGLAVQSGRTAAVGGWMLAAAFAGFSIPWAIRVVRFPQLFGTWGGFAEEFALFVAAVIVAVGARRRVEPPAGFAERACIVAFGVCAIAFGLNHFFALPQTAGMVPAWIPPGPMFWAVATGVLHAAAGIAIVSGFRAILAARLLAAMILVFEALIWLPDLAGEPGTHMVWAGNGVNLALAGATLVVADAVARRRGRTAAALRGSSATIGHGAA